MRSMRHRSFERPHNLLVTHPSRQRRQHEFWVCIWRVLDDEPDRFALINWHAVIASYLDATEMKPRRDSLARLGLPATSSHHE
jgi:hypothetical protein